jgi:SWI/SNF-related matrix-associated actin-dependent regulator of chromatin subfamily A member 5
MREYQLEGLNWMISLHDRGISGILADEMGLGKTLQSISLLTYVKEFRNVKGPHLVLVPKSVLGNWYREFTKFAPSIKAFKMQAADKEERLRMVREELVPGKWEVIITSFETFCIENAAFKKLQYYYIVIDEAHRIKNEKSVLAQRVRQMDSEFRLLLTGTPLQVSG